MHSPAGRLPSEPPGRSRHTTHPRRAPAPPAFVGHGRSAAAGTRHRARPALPGAGPHRRSIRRHTAPLGAAALPGPPSEPPFCHPALPAAPLTCVPGRRGCERPAGLPGAGGAPRGRRRASRAGGAVRGGEPRPPTRSRSSNPPIAAARARPQGRGRQRPARPHHPHGPMGGRRAPARGGHRAAAAPRRGRAVPPERSGTAGAHRKDRLQARLCHLEPRQIRWNNAFYDAEVLINCIVFDTRGRKVNWEESLWSFSRAEAKETP